MLPWAWPIYAGLGLYRALEHELSARERTRLRKLARKSRGLPMRLSTRERDEVVRIISRISPFTTARFVVAEASPLPWPKAPESR